MRTLPLLLAALFASPASAQDPKLPADLNVPTTAYAKAAADAGKVTITLRLVEAIPATEKRTVTVYETVTKTVNGKTVTEVVPVLREVTVMVMKPKAWREAKVNAPDKGVSVHDAAGKPVAADKLAALLAKETPVLVSANGPVDPFHLLTAKEGTLVIVVPAEVLYPPPSPVVPKG